MINEKFHFNFDPRMMKRNLMKWFKIRSKSLEIQIENKKTIKIFKLLGRN